MSFLSALERDFLCLDFVLEIVRVERVEAAFLGFRLRIH